MNRESMTIMQTEFLMLQFQPKECPNGDIFCLVFPRAQCISTKSQCMFIIWLCTSVKEYLIMSTEVLSDFQSKQQFFLKKK
jgi:hypothetical protein